METTDTENRSTQQRLDNLPLPLIQRRQAAPRIPFEDITKECRAVEERNFVDDRMLPAPVAIVFVHEGVLIPHEGLLPALLFAQGQGFALQ